MTNPYFERPSSVTAGTFIRSDKYNSDLDTQESAFNALHDKLQHAVFLPETFSGNPNIPEQTVNDTFIYIDTSGNIALYPIATILEQFEEVGQRHAQIEAWKEQVVSNVLNAQESASLSQRFANEAENVEVVSGLYSAKHWAKHAEAQIPLIEAAGQAKVDEAEQAVIDAQAQVALATTQADDATTQASNASASATKADNFANYAHNQFVPNSGGKYSSYHWAKEAEAYAQQTLDTVNGDFVPSQRTVNGKALSSNIIINTADIPDIATVAATGSYDDLTNVPTDLLRDGDYGVGSLASCPDWPQTSLNNVTGVGAGIYRATGATTERPVNQNGVVWFGVMASGSTEYTQIYQPADSGEIGTLYHRSSTGGTAANPTWSAWRKVWDDGSLVKTASATDTTSNSILKVNDFGLGDLGAAVPNNDVYQIKTNGFYRCAGSADNAPNIGGASTSACTVIGAGFDSNDRQLIFLSRTTAQVFFNRQISGAWQGWNEFWTDANLNLSNVATSGDYGDLSNKPTAASLGAVSTSRKVNNKALTGDITLNADDVGAIPNTQNGSKLTRVSGSFTATRLAGVTEYVTTSTGNTTCTINDSAFAADEKLIIHKQRQSGQLNIVSGSLIYLENGESASSHHIPAGYACTVELVFTGSSSELRIYK